MRESAPFVDAGADSRKEGTMDEDRVGWKSWVPEPEELDEDEPWQCDECHSMEGHMRGCPWGDDTDYDYELAQDLGRD